MNLWKRVREAAERFADAVQERAQAVIERARERFRRVEEERPIYKEEREPEPIPLNPPEYEQSLSERLKEEDLKVKEEQHRKAWESFNSEFMTDGDQLSRMEYDLMWDTIGEYSNDSDALGSPDLIEIYDAMTAKYGYDIDADFVRQFLDKAIQDASVDAIYKEDYINAIYDAISNTGSVEEFYDTLDERVY